ncbi:unnamed protein product [Blepharisma stoltei]|uniref:Uncharacterized protein n=1 Tax=Blepharisma stoltei TaxID=1481888 RepID=A0AAU9K9C9_9CILI|nr:unnamed protein product [Blepharisma stoltei]
MQKKKKSIELKLDLTSTLDTSSSNNPYSPVRFFTKRNIKTDRFKSESPNEKVSVTDKIFSQESRDFLRKLLFKKAKPKLVAEKLSFSPSSTFGKTQINSPVMKTMTPTQRSKIIQMACEDPGVHYSFMNRKLFIKDLASTSPLIVKRNKIENNQNSTENLFNRTQEFAYGRPSCGFEKERLMKRHKNLLVIQRNLTKKRPKRKEKCEKIDLIIKSCEDIAKSASTLEINNKIGKVGQIAKNYSEKMSGISNALRKVDSYEGSIMEKLYEYYQEGEKSLKSEESLVFKDMQNSSSDARRQNIMIRGLLKRYKNKVL